jgi:thermitase
MNQKSPDAKNPAEVLITKPIRASITAVALALMLGLALNSVITGVYALKDGYAAVIAEQESQLAAISSSRGKITKVDTPVSAVAPRETNRIIVKFKEGAALPPGLAIASEKANLEKAQGLAKLFTIQGINADVYEIAEENTAQEVIARLMASKRDLIEYAEVDMLVSPSLIPNDPNYSNQWQHPKVNTPVAWDSAQGEGVVIGIADTGVDCTHPDLAASCVPGKNLVNDSSDTVDINGHGTAVAGVAAQIGNNAVGATGIAFKAKIMPLRVSNNSDGSAYFSDIAEAFTYGANNGAKVVNASYGVCDVSTVISAIQYLRSKGGVGVIAAGNSGSELMITPSDQITCVSATNINDTRTSWSSFGQYVDVSSPGENIYATTRGGGYGGVSGTSFSSPLVAGIYALVFSANTNLTPSQADTILFANTDDLGEPGWDKYYGHGRVNAAKAVAAAIAAVGVKDTTAPSIPSNLKVSNITSSGVSLSWSASTDNSSGVSGYGVYRDGTKLTTVSATAYTDSGLSPSTRYSYSVRAEDVAGNISANSPSVVATTTTASSTMGIISYSIASKTNNSAVVSVVLSQPAPVSIKYGTSSNNLNLVVQGSPGIVATTTHLITLPNLNTFTTYYYQVVVAAGSAGLSSPISSFKTRKFGGNRPPR